MPPVRGLPDNRDPATLRSCRMPRRRRRRESCPAARSHRAPGPLSASSARRKPVAPGRGMPVARLRASTPASVPPCGAPAPPDIATRGPARPPYRRRPSTHLRAPGRRCTRLRQAARYRPRPAPGGLTAAVVEYGHARRFPAPHHRIWRAGPPGCAAPRRADPARWNRVRRRSRRSWFRCQGRS